MAPTQGAKWNSDIINFIIFPTVTWKCCYYSNNVHLKEDTSNSADNVCYVLMLNILSQGVYLCVS